jgi:ADP-ribose pyrophosphatase
MSVVYKGRVFSVEVEHLRLPSGRSYEISVVRHPPSVVLITMKDPRHVILIRQYRPSIGRELWEFPAGSLNTGETADAAALRECEEEIGLVPQQIQRIRGLFPAPGFCDEELVFYRVSDFRAKAADSLHKPDEDEDIHAQVFSIDEAKAMAERGEIVDLKTAYALTLI